VLGKRYKNFIFLILSFKVYGSNIRQLLDLFKLSISSICGYLDGNNI